MPPSPTNESPKDAVTPAAGVETHDQDKSTLPKAAQLHLWQIQGVRDVITIVAVVGLVYVGYWMRSVTVPLLIALVLAYLFEPVVQRLCRFRGITRPGAVLIILLTVGVGVTVAGTLTIPRAIGETVNLVRQVRTGQFTTFADRLIEFTPEEVRGSIKEFVGWFRGSDATEESNNAEGESDTSTSSSKEAAPAATDKPTTPIEEATKAESKSPTEAKTVEPRPDDKDEADRERREKETLRAFEEDERVRAIVRAELDALGLGPVVDHSQSATAMTSSAITRMGGAPWRILGALGSTIESVGQFLLWIVQLSLLAFLVPFYFYFFSVSFPAIVAFGGGLIPRKNRERSLELIGMMDRAVSGFVRGRIVIAGIMGAMFAIGWIFCGVPYAITLGLLVGAMSLVPYLGGIGLPLAVGFLLFDQLQLDPSMRMSWWAILLWPSVVFLVVQTIESYVLTPMIAGKATDLDPVTIVVAILAGGSVAGVYGMILAIPAAACGKILLREVVLPRVHAWSRGEVSDPLPLEQKE